MTCNVIAPRRIVDADFVSSTVPEADYPVWSSATAYAIGARVILTAGYHSIYECLIANTNAHPATDTSSPPKWQLLAPTNRWAMHDIKSSVGTTVAGGFTATFVTGRVNALYLRKLLGESVTVTMTNGIGGPVVYTRTVSLLRQEVFDLYDLFFSDIEQQQDVALTDLPPYINGVLTITVTAVGSARIGNAVAGTTTALGAPLYGASASAVSYSRIETNAFGETAFQKGVRKKTASLELAIPVGQVNRAVAALDLLDGTPAVFLGVEAPGYEGLNVLGFSSTEQVTYGTPSHSQINLNLREI